MDEARHAQDMDMPDAQHAQAHLHQAAGRAHPPPMSRYMAPNGLYYPSLQQAGMNGANGSAMGARRSVGGIDVDALAAGVQRFLPNSSSGAPIASSSASRSLSHPALHSHSHPHSHAHRHHPHMSLSSTPQATSSSNGAYIALPHGMDPSTVDFRTFYPYNPSEVKHRKRTTRQQLKILEDTFRRETKPNAVMRKALAAELEMTPRGVQVWFQNRRAKEKAIQKKASAGGDKKPIVRLGKDKDDSGKDGEEDGDGDELEVDPECDDIDLDGEEKPDDDELSTESTAVKAKSDAKPNSSDGNCGANDTQTSGSGASATASPPSSSNTNTNSSPDEAHPHLPLAVEIPQPPLAGVRVSPPTSIDDKTDGSPKRLSPSGLGVSRMSWSQGSDVTQQQQQSSSANLPPARTTPTPNIPSLEDETLLSLRRPSLPTHLHSYGQNSPNLHGSGGPPNAFRMHAHNPRAARGLGSYSGSSNFHPLAVNGFDPTQRRMSLDRLSRHPYAHLAAQANGYVFGGGVRYRPNNASVGVSGSRLPIGPKTGMQAQAHLQNPNAMQMSPPPNMGLGLQTIGSVANTPTHTPQARQSELPLGGGGDAPGMDTEVAPDQVVPPLMQQQIQAHQQQQQQHHHHQYLHISRPELMHRASLPAQPAIQFRNPFDSIGANGDNSGDGNGVDDNAMQGIQTSGVHRGPLSASAIETPPMFTNPFASSQHPLHGEPHHQHESTISPYSDSGAYVMNPAAHMRFPREGHSYVLSTRTYQPPLAGPLPNPDFQFGTGTSPGSGESDGSGSSESPDSGAGPASGADTEQGLQNYTFPGASDVNGGVSDANANATAGDTTTGTGGGVYEMQELSGSGALAPFHGYMGSRFNSVISVADSEVSVASHYSNAPSEVGSYDVGSHGHVQHNAQMQGYDDGRRPSCTGQMMELFSNLDVHNGSNLSLAQQHASQQQQLEAVVEQSPLMSNASPDGAVAITYASPSSSMSGSNGSDETQQQQNQNQNHGLIISQSSELANALQSTEDNSHLHPHSCVVDTAGDLSTAQLDGQMRPRPDSIDASSLATSHRSSSDMSSLMYPLSASASSSRSSLGFQPPQIHHRASDFRKPQPRLDPDFFHNYDADAVSQTGHYSPVLQSNSVLFDDGPQNTAQAELYATSPYESHGMSMNQSHSSMPPPQHQHAHLMAHGNGSYGQVSQYQHSQESLAFGMHHNSLGVGHSTDSFGYYTN